MPVQWDNVKKSLKGAFSTAAEKTEEYTKIGKLKIDILNLKHNLEKDYAALGRDVHTLTKKSKKEGLALDPKVKERIGSIEKRLAEIQAKETEIEKVKSEGDDKSSKKKTED